MLASFWSLPWVHSVFLKVLVIMKKLQDVFTEFQDRRSKGCGRKGKNGEDAEEKYLSSRGPLLSCWWVGLCAGQCRALRDDSAERSALEEMPIWWRR
jgi:hypothetical protein